MKMTNIRKFAAISLVGMALSACGGPSQEEIDALVKAANLSKSEMSAYKVCTTDMAVSMPILITSKGNWQMTRVPTEICLCQSLTIAKIFKDDMYTSHPRFVSFSARSNRKKIPKLNKKEMRPGINPDTAATKLESSFLNCSIKYQQENQEASAGMLTKLDPPKKKEDKDKKETQASN